MFLKDHHSTELALSLHYVITEILTLPKTPLHQLLSFVCTCWLCSQSSTTFPVSSDILLDILREVLHLLNVAPPLLLFLPRSLPLHLPWASHSFISHNKLSQYICFTLNLLLRPFFLSPYLSRYHPFTLRHHPLQTPLFELWLNATYPVDFICKTTMLQLQWTCSVAVIVYTFCAFSHGHRRAMSIMAGRERYL